MNNSLNISVHCTGLYKVVKYWPAKGKSGFKVWRYLLRRDDPTPAPWTEEGRRRMEQEGYDQVIYPEGYLDHLAEKEREAVKSSQITESDDENDAEEDSENRGPPQKKARLQYSITPEWKSLMEKDQKNCKIWDQVVAKEVANKKELTDYVEELFNCIICQVGDEMH